MRYIRYLKTPKTDGKKLTALITITSDLGDSFLADEVALAATVRSAEPHGDIYLRKSLKWTSGMRSLAVTFDLTTSDVDWPIRMHVGLRNAGYSDHFEKLHDSGDLPSLISAWSDVVNPENGIMEAQRRVERRFMPLSHRTLSVWEETGESIARHLWDAGIALTAYLDRTIALQAESVPLLEQVLGSATYKKLNVIELGSGCGIVGIGLAQTVPDCEVILTDLPEAEEIVKHNITAMNPAISSIATFQALDWEEPLPAKIRDRLFDMILVADCTYNPDSSPALVKTLSALVKRSPKAIIVVAMKVRHESESIFFDYMKDASLVIESRVILPLPRNEEWSDAGEHVDLYVFRDKERAYRPETPLVWVS